MLRGFRAWEFKVPGFGVCPRTPQLDTRDLDKSNGLNSSNGNHMGEYYRIVGYTENYIG